MRTPLIAAALAAVLVSSAQAHLSIKLTIRAPGGTRYEVWAADGDNAAANNMPPIKFGTVPSGGGGIQLVHEGVFGLETHDLQDTLFATLTDGSGIAHSCDPIDLRFWDPLEGQPDEDALGSASVGPQWHYQGFCYPIFSLRTRGGETLCETTCPVNPPWNDIPDGSRVLAYPNPARTGQGVAISEIPAGTRVRVYTVRGQLLADVSSGGGNTAFWNGKDRGGQPVASGVYLIAIEGPGVKKTMKIAVER